MKISELVNCQQKEEINLTAEDFDAIFKYEGFAYIKTLKCEHIDKCIKELENFKYKFKGAVVHFKINGEFSLMDIDDFMQVVYSIGYEESDIIFSVEESKKHSEIEIEIIFTGLDINN